MLLDDPVNYVDFLCKNKLSPSQFLLLYLLHTERLIREKSSKGTLRFSSGGLMYKWSVEGRGWVKEEIKDLITKDYVISLSPDLAYDQLMLTSKFSDLMFISGGEAFAELLELYPEAITMSNGERFMTKTVDMEEMERQYVKAIRNSQKKHEEVKELLIYGIEHKLVNTKLDKFILGKSWDSIKRLREAEGSGFGREVK